MKPYRNAALLATAKGQPCMLQIPGVCNGDESTVVACHSNMQIHGKGMGKRADDLFVSFGCANCHYELDYGTKLSREEKELAFYRGMSRTQRYWLAEGIIG